MQIQNPVSVLSPSIDPEETVYFKGLEQGLSLHTHTHTQNPHTFVLQEKVGMWQSK